MLETDRLLTEVQAAKILNLKPATLRTWRCRRKGPSVVKMGGAVRYPESGLMAFRAKGFVSYDEG